MDTTPATPTLSNHREREILDEKGLAEEARRTQKAIADNCG